MAVQAHYPSNVLFLNRNAQEGNNTIGNDYSIKQQTGEGGGAASSLLDHQPHMLFSSGVGNSTTRKRYQKQHPLHQQSLFSQSSQKSSVFLPFLSDDLASFIKQQQEEITTFINFQGEQLRHALAEKRQRNVRSLLSAAEASATLRLREKEAELQKASRHNIELEARAAQLSAESQAWQARAKEQELAAAALQAQLQQARLSGGGAVMGIGGVENDEEGVVEDDESVYIDPDRVDVLDGPSCKACRQRVASMVVLPCRHLCLCKECDSVARCCPLCYTFRNSSVEVVWG